MIDILKKDHINSSDWQFEFQQRNEHPILMADLFCRANHQNFPGEAHIDIPGYDYIFTYSSKGFGNKHQMQNIYKKIAEASRKDAYLKYVVKYSIQRMVELDKAAEKTLKVIKDSKISNKDLSKLWQDFDAAFTKVIPWFYIPWIISENNVLTDQAKEGLEKYRNKLEKITDFNNVLMLLVFPMKKAAFQRQQDDFFELVDFVEKNKKFKTNARFKKILGAFLEKYSWTTTFLVLPLEPLSDKQVIEQIKQAIKTNAKEEYELQKNKKQTNDALLKKIYPIIKKDKELLRAINWAREIGWVLTESVEQAMKASAKYLPLFKLVSKRIGIRYDEIRYLRSEEIGGSLKNSELTISENDLNNRKVGHIFAGLNGEMKMVVGTEGKELSDWFERAVQGEQQNIKEFKGQPASPGLVRGKARVCNNAAISNDLKNGEILVCAMTTPDYVPAMKRAAAIVTNEGGLLCHAAIISRELHKPCVIATKVATSVIKTGDLVEVDANTGAIRILDK